MAVADPPPLTADPVRYKITFSVQAGSNDLLAVFRKLFSVGGSGQWQIRSGATGADVEIPNDLVLDGYRYEQTGDGTYRLEFHAYSFDHWLERRRMEARPYVIDDDLVIKPSWDRRQFRGKTVVRIDPGLAFGTGSHPTTKICLLALKKLIKPGARVVDIGCGTGILAIAAARLGAAAVIATDVDPIALVLARQNARRNRVARKIKVVHADSDTALPEDQSDLVIANLTLELHRVLAADTVRYLHPHGQLICSGFNEDSAPAVRDVFTAEGMAMVGMYASGDWRALVFKHD